MAVAWFTAAEEESVKVARSIDRGQNFQSPVDIEAGPNQGRVDVAILSDSCTLVSWMAIKRDNAELCLRSVDLLGNLGPIKVVAVLSKGRQTGFPRMAAVDSEAYIVWTDVSDQGPKVLAARVVTTR